VDLTFRGRIAEIAEAIWATNKGWIPSRVFKADNYSAGWTDPKEWLEVLAGTKSGNVAAVLESADKQQLFAQVTLWDSGTPLTVNTTWKPDNKTAPTQQWKDAILSTLQLPIVQDSLVKMGWPKDPSTLPRDDQTLLAFGMVFGDLPVKRMFTTDPQHGLAMAMTEGQGHRDPMLVHTKNGTMKALLPDTTYILSDYVDEYTQNGSEKPIKYEEKDWKVSLGLSVNHGQPEDVGFVAQVSAEDLLADTDYVVHRQTRSLENFNCGWLGKKAGENRCP
jgi:hypothetical protein